ncbi:hypothetical protein DdX_16694 [Ditylenchus destructor]|uniref:Uncharacterized protein n=1 Tax=Ditylenchus destructor TaxID=166010 RepID=A0AAD4MT58_9BILA|nr:hypothetical protein DdX_16694 [Ditylenchus destructor]
MVPQEDRRAESIILRLQWRVATRVGMRECVKGGDVQRGHTKKKGISTRCNALIMLCLQSALQRVDL